MNKLLSFIVLLSIICVGAVNAHAETNTCVDLQSDLNSGMSGSRVISLQKYLQGVGYLQTTPNGYFGPATLSAVKRFQSVNSISTTGTVGPRTRALIKQKTCANSNANADGGIVVNPTVSPTAVPQTSTITIDTPRSGANLTIGNNINISWNNKVDYINDILLEDRNGAGAGYIASSLMGENSYQWKAGSILNIGAQTSENIATGTYRIRIRKSGELSNSKDPVSGYFTLSEPPLSISTVIPTIVPADDKTVVVVFGKGFDDSSYIRFDSSYGMSAHTLYRSADGKVIVFSVLTNISNGPHSIMVSNQYGSLSNPISISVTQ